MVASVDLFWKFPMPSTFLQTAIITRFGDFTPLPSPLSPTDAPRARSNIRFPLPRFPRPVYPPRKRTEKHHLGRMPVGPHRLAASVSQSVRPTSTNDCRSLKATVTSARPPKSVSRQFSTVQTERHHRHRRLRPQRKRSHLGVSVARRRSCLPRRTTHPPHTVHISALFDAFSISTTR